MAAGVPCTIVESPFGNRARHHFSLVSAIRTRAGSANRALPQRELGSRFAFAQRPDAAPEWAAVVPRAAGNPFLGQPPGGADVVADELAWLARREDGGARRNENLDDSMAELLAKLAAPPDGGVPPPGFSGRYSCDVPNSRAAAMPAAPRCRLTRPGDHAAATGASECGRGWLRPHRAFTSSGARAPPTDPRALTLGREPGGGRPAFRA